MRIHGLVALVAGAGVVGFLLAGRPLTGQGQGTGFAAVPGEKGGWDVTGPYDVVRDWPNIRRPQGKAVPEFGPSLTFPVGQAPFRNASQGPVSSPPGAGGPGQDPDDPAQAWQGKLGVDARWEHCLVVVNANGDIVEEWTQWDSLFKRPHAIYINPYDAEKHVWVVDDHNQAIFKFTND